MPVSAEHIPIHSVQAEPAAENVRAAENHQSSWKSRAARRVGAALDSWWDSVGPGSVERAFVDAHDAILASMDGEDRKAAFEQSREAWRKRGRALGITSAVLDAGVSALSGYMLVQTVRHPETGGKFREALMKIDAGNAVRNRLLSWHTAATSVPMLFLPHGNQEEIDASINRAYSWVIGGEAAVGTAIPLVGAGPAHVAARTGAKLVQYVGKGMVGTGNYMRSDEGKARMVAVGQGISAAAQYGLEHQKEISEVAKTVNTVAKDQQKMKLERQRATAEAERRKAIEFERKKMEVWKQMLASDASLKAYFVNSGTDPYASIPTEYVGEVTRRAREQEAAAAASGKTSKSGRVA